MMEQVIINIFASSQEDGFVYDIYDSEEDLQNGNDSIEGGICTGSFEAAVQMAADAVIELADRARIEHNENPS